MHSYSGGLDCDPRRSVPDTSQYSSDRMHNSGVFSLKQCDIVRMMWNIIKRNVVKLHIDSTMWVNQQTLDNSLLLGRQLYWVVLGGHVFIWEGLVPLCYINCFQDVFIYFDITPAWTLSVSVLNDRTYITNRAEVVLKLRALQFNSCGL